jgi:RNA polymerase sigma factor (sigma-70 family)
VKRTGTGRGNFLFPCLTQEKEVCHMCETIFASNHELILNHLALCKHIAWKWSRRPSDFDDNLSECYVKVCEIARYWRPGRAKASTTFYYTSLNRHLATYRRRQSRRSAGRVVLEDVANDAAYDEPLDTSKLANAMERLTSRELEVLGGKYWRKVSYKITASNLGVSRQRCEQLHKLALARLRERMAPCD